MPKKLLITILFFGFPVLLFIGSYFYEFSQNFDNKINKEIRSPVKKELLLTHKFDNKISIIFSGNLLKRFNKKKLKINELKVINGKTGKIIVSYPNFINCILEIKNKVIKIKEFLSLPIKENQDWEETNVSEKIISFKEDKNIEILEKISSYIRSLSLNFRNFKKEILYRKECGFEELKKKDQYYKSFIGKLFIFSMKNNKLAQDTLKNFESFFKVQIKDRSLKEWYRNLKEKIKLHFKDTNKSKENLMA